MNVLHLGSGVSEREKERKKGERERKVEREFVQYSTMFVWCFLRVVLYGAEGG